MQPTFAIPGEFKQKFLFVAPMGNLPRETLFGFCLTGVCHINPGM
jgi:hypothetical protein